MSWRPLFRSGGLLLWSLYEVLVGNMTGARAAETVTIYPSYAYQDGDTWIISMRLWVHEDRPTVQSLVTGTVAKLRSLTTEETRLLNLRIREFVADSESGELVEMLFPDDPREETFRLLDEGDQGLKSDKNGIVQGTLRLSIARAREIQTAQRSTNNWLKLKVISSGHTGEGRVLLMPSEGLSVVSDVDDTIKITQIPAGSSAVMRNTFLRPFEVTPEMPNLYRNWPDASFHYVSGSPWQLHEPLSQFLEQPNGAFPQGTWHMKTVTKNLLSGDTWSSLSEVIMNANVTRDQKLAQISELVTRFPNRRFILIGDSGEKDPEVYQEIRTRFPKQIQEIWIRDVVNDREKRPERLRDMRIIAAETVLPESGK